MKIGIDISQSIFGTGVSVYTKSLISALLKVDQENEYLLYGGSLRRYSELKSLAESFKGNVSSKIFTYPPMLSEFVWNGIHTFPVEKLIGKVDVLHTSDWVEPPTTANKVTTVHDLYPFKFPKMVSPRVLTAHKRKMSWVFQESKRIIVPSVSTKQDLVEIGGNEEIIRVIPEAPALSRAQPKDVEDVKSKYQINGDYLICIGITQLKNTQSIIKAFHLAKSGKEIKLILVGRQVDVDVKHERNIRVLGHVPQGDLSSLLTGSLGLIFASLYEGYGIPILDAFNCGVPVVTSNISSMPEVAGDAAVLVDPTDINSISEGIEKVLRGPKGLVEKGYDRVKQFTWEKAAKNTIEVYNEAKS